MRTPGTSTGRSNSRKVGSCAFHCAPDGDDEHMVDVIHVVRDSAWTAGEYAPDLGAGMRIALADSRRRGQQAEREGQFLLE